MDGLDGNELFTPRTVGFEEEHIVKTEPNNNLFHICKFSHLFLASVGYEISQFLSSKRLDF